MCLPLSNPSARSLPCSPFLCIHVIHMHTWRVAELAEEEMDGLRPAVCHGDGQKSIIYGGKMCLSAALGKSFKSSCF